MDKKFLYDLLSHISVSGCEEQGQEYLRNYMQEFTDEIRVDEMENTVCVINQNHPIRIMLSAHADEIGLMVTRITGEGRIQAIERGGIIHGTYPGQKVRILTKNGTVYGVVEGSREIFKKESLKAADFIIDIGATSKEEAENVVSLGDSIVLDSGVRDLMNERIAARALDDKIGVFIIMEALKCAKEKGCHVGVYAAATVGEETTKNGAFWSSARIQPTAAVVVDVTYCTDYSGVSNPAESGDVLLGGGPVLCNSPLVAKRLNGQMEEAAERMGIFTQREAASNWSYTDGDKIHFSNEGVPTVLVSIPLRNMHTPGEIADMKDVEGCIEMIAEFLCSYEK